MPDLDLESRALHPVAGIDEAGRGPWAGPVVAAAVILSPQTIPMGIDDSKRLSKGKRAALFDQIIETSDVGIGEAKVDEIDALNILQATMLAMQRAVAALITRPAHILVDGNQLPELPCRAQAIIKGDTRSLSIAAASIIAKEKRDQYMRQIGQHYPAYGWERNAGYGTKEHIEALRRFGPSPHHRRSFKPVRESVDNFYN